MVWKWEEGRQLTISKKPVSEIIGPLVKEPASGNIKIPLILDLPLC